MLEEGVACLPLYTKDNKKFGSPIKCYALCLGYDDGKDSNFPLAALAPVLPLQHIISAIVLTVEHIDDFPLSEKEGIEPSTSQV